MADDVEIREDAGSAASRSDTRARQSSRVSGHELSSANMSEPQSQSKPEVTFVESPEVNVTSDDRTVLLQTSKVGDENIADKKPVTPKFSGQPQSACRAHSRDTRRCLKHFQEMIGKHETRNDELEQREVDLRQRLNMLECSMPAVMSWNMWRMAQDAPVSNVRRLLQKQFQDHGADGTAVPNTPSKHYDCRVREIEAERKEALRRAEEARVLLAEKEAAVQERRKLLEDAKRCNQEKRDKMEKLSREAAELRSALKNARGDDNSCETGECGEIRCRDKWLDNVGSVSSIGSTDLECFAKLQELAEAEICMKRQITELERREEAYMRTLQQADELWSKMEGDSADAVSNLQDQLGSKTAANQQLADRVCSLEDELEKAKNRLTGCKDALSRFTDRKFSDVETGFTNGEATVKDRGIIAAVKTATASTAAVPTTADQETLALREGIDKESSFVPELADAASTASPKMFDKDSEALVDHVDRGVDRPTGLGIDAAVGDDEARVESPGSKTAALRSQKRPAPQSEDAEDEDTPQHWENWNWDEGCPPDAICDDLVESSTGTDDLQGPKGVPTVESKAQASPEVVDQPVGGRGAEDLPGIEPEVVTRLTDATLPATGLSAISEAKEVKTETHGTVPETDQIFLSREELRNWYNIVDSVHHMIAQCVNCSSKIDDTAQLAERMKLHLRIKGLTGVKGPTVPEESAKPVALTDSPELGDRTDASALSRVQPLSQVEPMDVVEPVVEDIKTFLEPVPTAPAAEEIPKKSPATEDIPEKSPAAEELPEKSPAAEEIPEKSPAAEEIPEKSPAAEEIPAKSRALEDIPEKSPAANEIPEKSPAAKEIPEKSPAAKEIPEKSPAAKEIPEKSPAAKEIPEKSPAAKEIPEKSPVVEDIPKKSPAAEEISDEILVKTEIYADPTDILVDETLTAPIERSDELAKARSGTKKSEVEFGGSEEPTTQPLEVSADVAETKQPVISERTSVEEAPKSEKSPAAEEISEEIVAKTEISTEPTDVLVDEALTAPIEPSEEVAKALLGTKKSEESAGSAEPTTQPLEVSANATETKQPVISERTPGEESPKSEKSPAAEEISEEIVAKIEISTEPTDILVDEALTAPIEPSEELAKALLDTKESEVESGDSEEPSTQPLEVFADTAETKQPVVSERTSGEEVEGEPNQDTRVEETAISFVTPRTPPPSRMDVQFYERAEDIPDESEKISDSNAESLIKSEELELAEDSSQQETPVQPTTDAEGTPPPEIEPETPEIQSPSDESRVELLTDKVSDKISVEGRIAEVPEPSVTGKPCLSISKAKSVEKVKLPKSLDRCICKPRTCPLLRGTASGESKPKAPKLFTEGTQTSSQMPKSLAERPDKLKLSTITESTWPSPEVGIWRRPMFWPRRPRDKSTLTTACVDIQTDSALVRGRTGLEGIDRKDRTTFTGVCPRYTEHGGCPERISPQPQGPVGLAVAELFGGSVRFPASMASSIEKEIAVAKYDCRSLAQHESELHCVECGRPITPNGTPLSEKPSLSISTKSQNPIMTFMKRLRSSTSAVTSQKGECTCCDCRTAYDREIKGKDGTRRKENVEKSSENTMPDNSVCQPCPADIAKIRSAKSSKSSKKKKRRPETKDQGVTADILKLKPLSRKVRNGDTASTTNTGDSTICVSSEMPSKVDSCTLPVKTTSNTNAVSKRLCDEDSTVHTSFEKRSSICEGKMAKGGSSNEMNDKSSMDGNMSCNCFSIENVSIEESRCNCAPLTQ